MRPKRSTAKTMRRAAELRRNLTPAEAKLWAQLRAHRLEGVGFRRQHAIGPFIVDFCAPGKRLIIEVDGSQHLDQQEYDQERTAFLEEQGFCVLRFLNNDVMDNVEGVIGFILEALKER